MSKEFEDLTARSIATEDQPERTPMKKPANKPHSGGKITTIRLQPEDIAIANNLRKHLGVKSRSSVVRMALRRLEQFEGLTGKRRK